MGNDSSKSTKHAESVPAPNNIHPCDARLSLTFEKHASTQSDQKKQLSEPNLQELFLEIPLLGKFLFKYISDGSPPKLIDRERFVEVGRNVLSMLSNDDQLQFYAKVLSGNNQENISREGLQNLLVASRLASFVSVGIDSTPSSDDDVLLDALVRSLFKDEAAEVSISSFCSWSNKAFSRVVKDLHSYVSFKLLGDKKDDTVAIFTDCDLIKDCLDRHSLITLTGVWLLANSLPGLYIPCTEVSTSRFSTNTSSLAEHKTWHNLYNSSTQGLSINRFQHHVLNYSGPTLLFVSFDKYLYVVGTDVEWRESGSRWGGTASTLVQLLPDYRVAQSGDGLVFFNVSDRTVPKGMHFGREARTTFLKIDSDLSKVTYYNVDYKLLTIEMWGCGGQEALSKQHKHKQWEKQDTTKHQNRKLVVEDWKDSPDKMLLDLGGVSTEHAERGDL